MVPATCVEEINSDQSWLQTLKDGIVGPLGAGMGDSVKITRSGGGILSPNAENISISGRVRNSSKEKLNGKVWLVRWLDKTVLSVTGGGVPRNFVRGGSTNSVEDRGQRTVRTGIWGVIAP